MRRVQLFVPAALGLLLLTVAFVWGFRAAAACYTYPSDVSSVAQRGDQSNCGETIWELKARFGAYIYDEGEYDGTGTSTGGYQSCDCTIVRTGFLAPSENLEFFDDGDGQTYTWWWDITNYLTPTYDNCTSGTCAGTGYGQETDGTYLDSGAGWDDETYVPCDF